MRDEDLLKISFRFRETHHYLTKVPFTGIQNLNLGPIIYTKTRSAFMAGYAICSALVAPSLFPLSFFSSFLGGRSYRSYLPHLGKLLLRVQPPIHPSWSLYELSWTLLRGKGWGSE